MKAKVPRVVSLTVAEVENMIASLDDAKTVRNLSGRQRQQLQESRDLLEDARNRGHRGTVSLQIQEIVVLLRCAMITQQWVSDALAELSSENTDE